MNKCITILLYVFAAQTIFAAHEQPHQVIKYDEEKTKQLQHVFAQTNTYKWKKNSTVVMNLLNIKE